MGPRAAGPRRRPSTTSLLAASGDPAQGNPWPDLVSQPLASVRYRGFVLIPQADLTWLIRPERSPMRILPFRAPASSLTDVKALVDWRLKQDGDH
jgi:hypothetical protein